MNGDSLERTEPSFSLHLLAWSHSSSALLLGHTWCNQQLRSKVYKRWDPRVMFDSFYWETIKPLGGSDSIMTSEIILRLPCKWDTPFNSPYPLTLQNFQECFREWKLVCSLQMLHKDNYDVRCALWCLLYIYTMRWGHKSTNKENRAANDKFNPPPPVVLERGLHWNHLSHFLDNIYRSPSPSFTISNIKPRPYKYTHWIEMSEICERSQNKVIMWKHKLWYNVTLLRLSLTPNVS